jgi:hypothetical protein
LGGFVIFGFNTDVKFENTVYHVQSEARQLELRLETQIFLGGRCIATHATSYADEMKDPGFSEERMHEMLKDQHKHFVAAVREGRIEAVGGEDREPSAPLPAALDYLENAGAISPPAAPDAFLVTPEDLPPPIHAAPLLETEPYAPLEPPPVELESWPVHDAPPPAIIEPEPLAHLQDDAPPPPHVEPEPLPEMSEDGMPSLDELAAQYASGALFTQPAPRAQRDPAQRDLAQSRSAQRGWSLAPAGHMIGKGLELECLAPAASPDGNEIIIAVRVSDESGPAAGAQVTCRVTSGNSPALYVYSTSGAEGVAGINLTLRDLDLASTALLVQASHRGKSAGRKYKLQSSS